MRIKQEACTVKMLPTFQTPAGMSQTKNSGRGKLLNFFLQCVDKKVFILVIPSTRGGVQIKESKNKFFFAVCKKIICLVFLELGAVDRAVGGATAVVLGK